MIKRLIISLFIFLLIINNFPVNADIDQDQPITHDHCGYAIFTDNWAAQSFTPDRDIITKIYLNLEITGDIEELSAISISITNIDPIQNPENNEYLTTCSLNAVDIKDQIHWDRGWVLFDIPDVQLTLDKKHFIIVKSEGGEQYTNYYELYYGIDTGYTDGEMFLSEDGGTNWVIKSDCDIGFQTWGYNLPSIEKKALIPDSYENNWVKELTVLEYEDNLKFKIKVFNNDPNESIYVNVVDKLPDFLIYKSDSSDSSVIPTYNYNILYWDNVVIRPLEYWEVNYVTKVLEVKSEIEGENFASVSITNPPCNNINDTIIKNDDNFLLNSIFSKINKDNKFNKIINFISLKLHNFFEAKFRFSFFNNNLVKNKIFEKNQDKNKNNQFMFFYENPPTQMSDQVKIKVEKNYAELKCDGDILLMDAEINKRYDFSFKIQNCGAPNSKLTCECLHPSSTDGEPWTWFDFNYDETSMQDLTPEMGEVVVPVWFALMEEPDDYKKNECQEGVIVVRNVNNHEMYDCIGINIKLKGGKLKVKILGV